MDFPQSKVLPLFISSVGRFGCGMELRVSMSSGTPAAITWVASTVCYIPFSIPWAYPVNRVWWCNGSTITTTNVDFGIYTVSGARIFSTGNVAMSGVSAIQYATPGTPFVLDAGQYYMAWACDNTTSRAFGFAPTAPQGAIAGCLSQASAQPLPTSATFATFGAPGIPVCGITRTASGF